MVSSDDPDAEDVLIVVEVLQPLEAGGRGEPGFYIHLPQAPDADAPLHDASADKGLVLLRLIESPNQRPHLSTHTQGRKEA